VGGCEILGRKAERVCWQVAGEVDGFGGGGVTTRWPLGHRW